MADNADRVKTLSNLISSHSASYSQKSSQGASIEDEALAISAACKELEELLTPAEIWMSRIAGSYNYCAAICLALDLDIPRILSEHSSMPLYSVAELTGAAGSLLRCVMALCVERHIFDEPQPEVYALNRNSVCLLDKNFKSWIHYLVDDGFRMGSCLPRCAFNNSYQIPDHKHKTAFEMAFQTNMSFYEYYHSADQKRGQRFDSAMERYFHRSAQTPIEDIFSFRDLQPGAILVDVGGGRGHHSIRLASQFPHISFTVQDFENKVPTINAPFNGGAITKITWQQHDFFKEQPVKGANIYFLSHILMDHSDSECRNILKHLVEAMVSDKSILLIDDFLDAGKECSLRSKGNILNIHHMAAFGRPFRTLDEWKYMFLATSSLLYIVNVSTYDNGRVVFTLGRSTY